MAKINLLDVQTSNLIAAGEVVERPANVLKELLENAIDAKSTAIVTEIEGGGVDLIRVSDNGCGMDREDLALAVRRHATSKIRTGADLDSITTLGFRGEALAAISSTSRFTMLSKEREADIGHQITLEGEEVIGLEECGCADGTTVLVRDLFFNQPARRKFLKRPQTESAAILQYLQRIAISHPEIAFRHSVDGAVKLQTVGNGKLYDCIYSVYGKEFAASLVALDETVGPYRIHGYITRPEMARNNHSYQSFYINSRFVKSRTMAFALEDAYKSFVKSEKFPGCVLFLELDPAQVDVNVHPAKLEVRFSQERGVYDAIYSVVRRALSSLSNKLARDEYQEAVKQAEMTGEKVSYTISETKEAPKVSLEVQSGSYREARGDLPLFSQAKSRGKTPLMPKEERILPKKVEVRRADFASISIQKEDEKRPTFKPETAEKEVAFPKAAEAEIEISEATEKEPPLDLPLKKEEAPIPEQLTIDGVLPEENDSNPIAGKGVIRGVLFNAYILYEAGESVYLIDKHAAHERILYEELKKNHKSESVQFLMEPLVLKLAPLEHASLAEHLKELGEAGFAVEEFGEGAFLVRGIPLEFISLSTQDVLSVLTLAAKELMMGGRAAGAAEKRFDRTLYSMACKAAVKAGIPSTDSDHTWLINKIREMDNVMVCPHGRPILVPLTKKEIEGMFLRT